MRIILTLLIILIFASCSSQSKYEDVDLKVKPAPGPSIAIINGELIRIISENGNNSLLTKVNEVIAKGTSTPMIFAGDTLEIKLNNNENFITNLQSKIEESKNRELSIKSQIDGINSLSWKIIEIK